jgi:hypothetical protein
MITCTEPLLRSAVRILDQDADLESLLQVLPSAEFQRVFFRAAEMALAEAYAKSEEMHERFETDAEYRDGFLARAYNQCVDERRVA